MFTPSLGPLALDGFNFRGLKSYLFYGDKGNGKSLLSSYLASALFAQYARTERKYPQLARRVFWSSQKFGRHVEEAELIHDPYNDLTPQERLDMDYPEDYQPIPDNPHGHLMYWSNPRQLYPLRNVDILWDEVGKDMPAGAWMDTPRQLRQVFSHLRKRGNRLFANTQIYNDIDISFRRQIDRTFNVRKFLGSPDISASLPPVKYIWGLVVVWEMNKNTIENKGNEEKHELVHKWAMPHFVLIEKDLTNYYDTAMEIPAYRPTQLEHLVFTCPHVGCNKVHVEHKKM